MRDDESVPMPPNVKAFLDAHQQTGEADEVALARVQRALQSKVAVRPRAKVRGGVPEFAVAAALVLLLGGVGFTGYWFVGRPLFAPQNVQRAYNRGDFEAARAALRDCDSESCAQLGVALSRAEKLMQQPEALSEAELRELTQLDQTLRGDAPSTLEQRLKVLESSVGKVDVDVGEEKRVSLAKLTSVAAADPTIVHVEALGDEVVFTGRRAGTSKVTAVAGGKQVVYLAQVAATRPGPNELEPIVLEEGERRIVSADGFIRIAIGEPLVADVEAVGGSQLRLTGKARGTTTMLIWLADNQRRAVLITVLKGAGPPPAVEADDDVEPCDGPLANCGRVLIKAQKYKAAEKVLQRCVASEPTNYDCFMLLGSAAARLDNAEEAYKAYEEFLRLAPDSHPKKENVKNLLRGRESLRQ